MFFFTDGKTFGITVFTDFMDQFRDPCGVGLFEVAVDGQDANVTKAQLSRVVDEARRVSWCVTVVVVSDDPAFLATFAEWSLKGHLLVWSTRLLAVTHLPLPDLRYIHRTFSRMNAMVVIVKGAPETLKCNVYIHLPYSSPEDRAMRLAFWTPQRGLTLNTHLPLFPDKYSKPGNEAELPYGWQHYYSGSQDYTSVIRDWLSGKT
ncbi:putative olfactory ionotropic receptor IR4-like 16, partial [Homarus americanus]